MCERYKDTSSDTKMNNQKNKDEPKVKIKG